MSVKRTSLVHSLSMFQPSLIKPDQTPPNHSTNSYKPPLFTSSCNSIPEDSRRSTTNNHSQSYKRSHSVRRSQFKNRSQSIGGAGAPPLHRRSISSQARHDGQKGSIGSMTERKTSVASISHHFSSLMEISSQVRREILRGLIVLGSANV